MTGPRTAGPVDAEKSPAAIWKPLDARAVTIDGGVWARAQAVNHDAAIPHGYRMLEKAGNLENLRIAAGRSGGQYRGPVFMDSDVYKWLEAAACEMARVPSPSLLATCNEVIDLVAAAQGADGYINSHYTVAEPNRRWTDFAHGHELYCCGHLIQAAVAYRRATGDDRLLAIAGRFVDYLHARFGPGRRVATPGHPEIELALAELYRETGERRHLDLAAFFLEHRGHGWLGPGRFNSPVSFQDRVPVRQSTTVEGHAVRALYLTTGVADLYLETGDKALLETLNTQWHDMVEGKLYLTGGVGARHHSEAFGHAYELPNDLAYCETCGAIASVMWSWRMLLATGESRFADLIERTLYNAILSGVSLAGDLYFYVNPLASNGDVELLSRGGNRRKEWHLVACCPPNVMRTFAALGHYFATRDGSGLQIHLYGPARIAADL
ncbi:MAG TPA: beta-L-arabinofuranosidase domain-containing protein, partial [Methylomirabilota bacterium]|nr:beta-L-arabinofuranosidase domain-containing protein [Methylomirabilota bacterium]